MIYDWYKIFNLATFEALGLVSQNITVELEGIGQKEILITKGNAVSIIYEGVFLTLSFSSNNPFEFEDHAVYVDESSDVWLGIVNES